MQNLGGQTKIIMVFSKVVYRFLVFLFYSVDFFLLLGIPKTEVTYMYNGVHI